MVSSLILYHPTVSVLTKCKMLRFIFRNEMFEIDIMANNTVIIYGWNILRMDIWQIAADLESTNIWACYGFGGIKKEARKKAMKQLVFRKNVDDGYYLQQIIQEQPLRYLSEEKTS